LSKIKEATERFADCIREQAKIGSNIRHYDEEDIGRADDDMVEAIENLIQEMKNELTS